MNHKSIYISSAEPHAGSLVVAIGFMEMLKGRYERVAFFRPIIHDDVIVENDIDFMLRHFALDMQYEECCGFTVSEYIDAYSSDREDKLLESLIRKINHLEAHYDFVIIEGSPRQIFDAVLDFDLNLEIAKNLDTVFPMIIIIAGLFQFVLRKWILPVSEETISELESFE